MFAVVRTGGKQYRVAPGDKIVVEKLDGNAGDRIELGDVLLAGNAGKLESTDGLKVAAEIVAQAKADKVTVFKKRRRHNYRRKKGHRQQHTILRIVAIGDHKEEKKAAPVDKPAKAPVPAPTRSSPAKVEEIPTENPAPDDQQKANPPVKTAAKTAAKVKPAAETKAKPAAKAKAPSTKNAAPAKPAPSKAAKPAAKKTPKAK